jgi:hypothetical protein
VLGCPALLGPGPSWVAFRPAAGQAECSVFSNLWPRYQLPQGIGGALSRVSVSYPCICLSPSVDVRKLTRLLCPNRAIQARGAVAVESLIRHPSPSYIVFKHPKRPRTSQLWESWPGARGRATFCPSSSMAALVRMKGFGPSGPCRHKLNLARLRVPAERVAVLTALCNSIPRLPGGSPQPQGKG